MWRLKHRLALCKASFLPTVLSLQHIYIYTHNSLGRSIGVKGHPNICKGSKLPIEATGQVEVALKRTKENIFLVEKKVQGKQHGRDQLSPGAQEHHREL